MNFPIQHIEFHLDDSIIEIGERLIENKRIRDVHEPEKNLWISTVLEGQSYEVELQLIANKVKAVTCDCAAFTEKQMCSHIAGTLLIVRERLKERNAQRNKNRKQQIRQTHRKLTTNAILQSISHDDLMLFVKNYARGHRHFSVSLKTQFANRVDLLDTKEKYRQLLGAAISMHQSSKKTINQRGVKQVQDVVAKLLSQADDAIALHNYAEAVAIVEATLERFSPLLRFSEDIYSDSVAIIKRCMALLHEISIDDIAPDLRLSIWDLGMAEAFKSFYLHEALEYLFFKLLLGQVDGPEKRVVLLEKVEEQLEREDISEENRVNMMGLQLSLYEKANDLEAVEALIENNFNQPSILLIALENAIEKKQFKRAKQLATNALEKTKVATLIAQIEQYLLRVAQGEGDENAVFLYAEKQFLYNYDMQYYQILKNSVLSDTALATRIIQAIEKHPYSFEKRDVIAQIYAYEKEFKALMSYLEQRESLDLLKQYDAILVKKYKKRIYALYGQLLSQYLQNHVGRIPSQRVAHTMQHLRNIGAHDLADRLVDSFRDEFSERHTLIQELQFL